MTKKTKKRYEKKGSRTERIVRDKFGMELEEFLHQKREIEFLTDAEIASMLGVHAGTIQKNREKFGIKFRLAGMRNKNRNDEICQMMATGKYTLQAVGDMYGLSRERVRQILSENASANRRLANLKRKRKKEIKKGNGDGL